MHMRIDHARHDRAAGKVENIRIRNDASFERAAAVNSIDLALLYDKRGVGDRRRAGPVN